MMWYDEGTKNVPFSTRLIEGRAHQELDKD
jgi:hypothetical protein